MADHNGNSFDLGRMWGRIETHIERQTDILLTISDKLDALPSRLSTVIATEQRPSRTENILNAIPPVFKAGVPLLTIYGLMTKQIAWTDLWSIFGQ